VSKAIIAVLVISMSVGLPATNGFASQASAAAGSRRILQVTAKRSRRQPTAPTGSLAIQPRSPDHDAKPAQPVGCHADQ
jgi:hypothetical protein